MSDANPPLWTPRRGLVGGLVGALSARRAPGVLPDRGLPTDRRRALERLALGLTGLGVVGTGAAGCFDQARAQLPDAALPPPEDRDLDLLETLAIMEDVAWRTYVAAETLLSPALLPAAQAFGEHHREHRDDACARLKAAGGTAPTFSEAVEGLPELDGDRAVLAYALATERQAVNAYRGIIGQLTSESHRIRAADILSCEVSHFMALRVALGTELPADDPLVVAALGSAGFAFFTDLPAPPSRGMPTP